ncbi:hypothetical protein [Streptomyces sp. NPDC002676]
MTARDVFCVVWASLACLWGGVREARLRRYGVHAGAGHRSSR